MIIWACRVAWLILVALGAIDSSSNLGRPISLFFLGDCCGEDAADEIRADISLVIIGDNDMFIGAVKVTSEAVDIEVEDDNCVGGEVVSI